MVKNALEQKHLGWNPGSFVTRSDLGKTLNLSESIFPSLRDCQGLNE